MLRAIWKIQHDVTTATWTWSLTEKDWGEVPKKGGTDILGTIKNPFRSWVSSNMQLDWPEIMSRLYRARHDVTFLNRPLFLARTSTNDVIMTSHGGSAALREHQGSPPERGACNKNNRETSTPTEYHGESSENLKSHNRETSTPTESSTYRCELLAEPHRGYRYFVVRGSSTLSRSLSQKATSFHSWYLHLVNLDNYWYVGEYICHNESWAHHSVLFRVPFNHDHRQEHTWISSSFNFYEST